MVRLDRRGLFIHSFLESDGAPILLDYEHGLIREHDDLVLLQNLIKVVDQVSYVLSYVADPIRLQLYFLIL